MENFEILKTSDGDIYAYNDFSYVRDGENNLLKCQLDSCNATLTYSDDGSLQLNNYVDNFGHNHASTPYLVVRHKMLQEMIKKARYSLNSVTDIFWNVYFRNPAAGAFLNYMSISSILYEERLAQLPEVPPTINEFATCLIKLPNYTDLFIKSVTTENADGTAILLSNNELISAMERSQCLAVDGSSQFIPGVYVLLNVQTKKAYSEIWSALKDHLQDLRVTMFIANFEIALIDSIQEQFPDARVNGCWFYYSKTICAKWAALHLEGMNTTLLNTALCIPLLPPCLFTEARHLLEMQAKDITECTQDDGISNFVTYVRDTWLCNPRLTSLFGSENDINNALETNNAQTILQLTTHQSSNAWIFLDGMRKTLCNDLLTFHRLTVDPTPSIPESLLLRSDVIIDNQADLVFGRVSVSEFVQLMQPETSILSEKFVQRQPSIHNSDDANAVILMDEPLINTNFLGLNSTLEKRSEAATAPVPYTIEKTHSISNEEDLIEISKKIAKIILDELPEGYLRERGVILENAPSYRKPCMRCAKADSSHAFLPCGHLAICDKCKYALLDRNITKCLMCQVHFERIEPIFFL